MKNAIVFYSFSGKTKDWAQKEAAVSGADIFEVKEAKKRSKFTAFIPGCFQARGQKEVALAGDALDLNEYDKVVIAAPIWAGYPAPAFNSVVKMLPSGKDVELVFTSGGGNSKEAQKAKELVEKAGCTVKSYKEIKTGGK